MERDLRGAWKVKAKKEKIKKDPILGMVYTAICIVTGKQIGRAHV